MSWIHTRIKKNIPVSMRRVLSRYLANLALPILVEPPSFRRNGEEVALIRQEIMDFLTEWSGRIEGEVLDVGTGGWRFTRELLNGKCHYTACDFQSKDNVDVVCDVIKLSSCFSPEHFDFVIMTEVIEHVADPSRALSEIRAVMKPGGTLLLTTPFNYRLHPLPEVPDYWRFTQQGLRLLLREFDSVEIRSSGEEVFPFGYCVSARKPVA